MVHESIQHTNEVSFHFCVASILDDENDAKKSSGFQLGSEPISGQGNLGMDWKITCDNNNGNTQ